MEEHEVETSPRVVARICGVLYLIVIVIGLFGEAFVRGRIIVSGDAAATAANLRAMEPLWRFGIAAELVLLICAISMVVILFVLLRPVSRDLALLAVCFNVVSIAVEAVAALSLVAALFPLGNTAYLTAFTPEQLYAMASLSIRSHSYGFGVALIFFGCECLVLGYLIFKSGYLPKAIGVLMQIAGLCYLTNSFALLLSPSVAKLIFPAILIPAFVGEASLCLWLLVKGVNVEKWKLRAGARPARSVAAAAVALVFIASPALAQGDVGTNQASALTVGETFTIQSRELGETRRINVYLPPAYAASPETRLPVLYMPDGGMAEDFLHIAGLVQVSTGNGTMRPFLLVGIENTQRRRDLTGPTQNPEDKKIAPQVGGSAAFRRFIHSELMPAVEARYRTAPETAIMGESAAGLFVVETFFLEPDLFDTYIAFDPSLWWNNNELVNRATERLRATGNRQHTLYLASSSEDFARLTQQLADLLATSAPENLTWHYEPMPNETHATIYHPAALLALRRLFNPKPNDR